MTLSAIDLAKRLTRDENIALTLTNEYGESVTSREINTLLHTKNRVRTRWNLPEPTTNVSPFTKGFVHSGRTLWAVFDIAPVLLEGGSEVEFTYAG